MSFIKKSTRNLFGFIKRHKIITIFSVIVIAVLIYVFYPKPSQPIPTETIKRAEFTQSVSSSGKIDSTEKADLKFQVGGKIAYVGVKKGSYVTQGQLIVSLDQSQLQASLRQAEQDFTAAKAASEKYYDNHNDTETFEERVERTAIDAAQNKAYDQIIKARYDIMNSSLYTPIAGVITGMDTETTGVIVGPTATFSIANPNKVTFLMEIDQADISKVKEDQEVEIDLDSYPDKIIKTKISRIDYATHTTATGGNAYNVYADLPEEITPTVRIGMEGNGNIISQRLPNVVFVPISSVTEEGFVYVSNNKGKYEQRKVSTGIQNDTDVVIEKGISEGDKVVIDPTLVPQNSIIKSGGK